MASQQLTRDLAAAPILGGKPTPVDPTTEKSFATLVNDALRHADDSVIIYVFPKPGQTQPLLKLSSLAKFPPRQLEDADFRAELFRVATIGGAVLLVTLLIAWLINPIS